MKHTQLESANAPGLAKVNTPMYLSRVSAFLLLMLVLVHCSVGFASNPSAAFPFLMDSFASNPSAAFPFLMDIGGLSGATLSPNVPRVAAGRIFECPHPCGLVPHFDGAGQPVNGGLPQVGNLSLHLETLRETFDKYVPLNESRLMDFDFENWNPVWSRNSPSASPINVRNASVARVRAAHPDWDPDTVEAAAQAEFESAAQTWLAATMTYMRQIRPQLRVAMYGYPTRYYYHGYNDTTQGPLLRAQNDALFPLWCHMDAIMPSVYQFYDSCNRSSARAPNEEYVRSNVREAVRIAGEVARRCAAQAKPPVLVYTWHRYHDGARFVCDADETMTWSISAEEGASGVVLWGDERQTEDDFETYWAKDFAPLALGWSPPPELSDSGTRGSVTSLANQKAADQLQKRVNQAIADGAKDLYVPAGDYYFGNNTFLIESARDLTIYCDPPGSATLWNWGWLGAVQVSKSTNVTLKGFTIDRNPTPYIRGHVTSKTGLSSYTFRLASDSPTSLPLYWDQGEERWTYGGGQFPFGPNGTGGFPYCGGGARCGCGSFDPTSMVSLGGREYRIPGNGCSNALAVGDDFVAITWLGYGYGIGNSSKITSQDMAIRASPYMAASETDGGGGHVYRNFTVAPGPGRLISVNADGIHSEDVDVGPLIEDSTITRLLDDYWNVQNTIHLQMGNGTNTTNGYQITLVHPHTADAPTYYPDGTPIVDKQYGTTEPLLRVAPGDKLLFYDPITLAYLGERTVTKYPQPLDATANTTLGKNADALLNDLRAPPYHLGSFTKQNYKAAIFRSTAFQIELSEAPPNPRMSLPVPSLVEIEKTRSMGAVIRNSNFSYSTGFFGRLKSSNARIEGNRFAYNGNEELELSVLPTYYEGPIELRNVTITGNTFQLASNLSIEDIIRFTIQPSSENISTAGNHITVA